MANTHTTLAQYKTALASRLGDAGKLHWTDTELGLLAKETLRTWNAAAAYFREQVSFNTVSGQAFYDLISSVSSLAFSLQDRDLSTDIKYHLLEDITNPATWTGTEQFTINDVQTALEKARKQFLVDTGLLLTRTLGGTLTTPSRTTLDQEVVDLRRAAWQTLAGAYSTLWQVDEHVASSVSVGSLTTTGTPAFYSVAAAPADDIQLIPPSSANGKVETITVNVPTPILDIATGVSLKIPDDFCPFIKWLALGTLLSREGIAYDPARAQYCFGRYTEGVELAKISNIVQMSRIAGVVTPPISLHDLDAFIPNWQNTSGAPTMIALAGYNLVALSDVPNGVYAILLDIVTKATMPANDAAYVDVGEEFIEALLDYSTHLGSFKLGWAEFDSTKPLYENFMRLAALRNGQLRAHASSFEVLTGRSKREDRQRPRVVEAQP